MSSNPIQSADNILGYTLNERVGSGGYGEVWSAMAPGGIEKAVKFVYGYHEERRAQTEIKALNRVKQIRHPFLLSLERIDIVDGQLVIISELADGCLADLFRERQERGETGIPRAELLGYMRDAADALDYLATTHSLQHLDVKPENLLIIGGHVKVADFGLVKELDVTAQSLMTGMTPAYAAPELFDGQPGERSDQYSLAIVYQEMLTSMRPFLGATPAQLAAQHMHGSPNLRTLPKSDQPVIAKALSKDPACRYESCREMIDELANKRIRKKSIRRREIPQQLGESNTAVLSETSGMDVTAILSSANLPFKPVELGVLEPPELGQRSAEVQPVIVVAIGNMACQTVSQLKQRLVARHGSAEELPAFRVVCIDTERQALSELALAGGDSAMSESELLPTPLQKPEIYRAKASSHLNWLSRRWIYNIPRSLQTEGLRPLGRLAFADHFETICRRFQEIIEDVCAEENIAATAEAVGVAPGTSVQPRVYVISSISGGVSGMMLDLAYTLKTLFGERGITPSHVTGLLLHSTNRRAREPGLSAANAFATLTELRHYTDLGYPGDGTLGLPEFPDEPPFDHAYYLDLGADLPQTRLEEKLNSIAEWVYLNSLSNCSAFFDACREINSESEDFDLRTFGLSISGPGKKVASLAQANALALELLNKWTQGGPDTPFLANQKAAAITNEFELNSEGITNMVDELLQHQPGAPQVRNLLCDAREVLESAECDHREALSNFFDSVFGVGPQLRKVGYQEPQLVKMFEESIGKAAFPVGDRVAESVYECLQQDRLDLAEPRELVKVCLNRLDQAKSRLDAAARGCESQLSELLSLIEEFAAHRKLKDTTDTREMFEQALQSYCQYRWNEFVIRNSRNYCLIIRKSVLSVESMLENYTSRIGDLGERFDVTEFPYLEPQNHQPFDLEKLMMDTLLQSQSKLVERMEIQIFEELVRGKGSFLDLLQETFAVEQALPAKIREIAIQVVTDAYKKISVDQVIEKNQISPQQVLGWLDEQLKQAFPEVNHCGGGVRLLAGFPQHAEESKLPKQIEEQFGIRAASVGGTSGDFVLCYEGEDVSLASVAFRLLESRPDAADLSKRIHCRKDVDWSTLDDLL